MAEWRKLAEADVRAILSDFGVAGYRAHRPIAVGTINTNVAGRDRRRAALPADQRGQVAGRRGREAAIVAHVAARGVPTPVPRADADRPAVRAVARSDRVAVPLGRRADAGARRGDGRARARQAGAALARLHLAGADFADRRAGRYEPDEIDRRLAHIDRPAAGPELMPAVGDLAAGAARALARRARRASCPLGLIHGDLFIDNVLYPDDARWRRCSTSSRPPGAAWPTTWR